MLMRSVGELRKLRIGHLGVFGGPLLRNRTELRVHVSLGAVAINQVYGRLSGILVDRKDMMLLDCDSTHVSFCVLRG
jgi:hypothetical protein